MKALLSLIAILFSLISPLKAQKSSPAALLQQSLEQDVADGQFAGVVAGLSVGEEVIMANAGYRDVESETPFERLTVNRTASIAKSMTAVAALQLYERGALDLDEPIATYLPNYPKRHADRITSRMLLLHSSGIGAYASGKEAQSEVEYESLTASAKVFQDRDLIDEPGNAEHYTTYGYVVLGMVIEAVSGQTYEDYMEEHIWGVAGMTKTSVEHLKDLHDNKSSFYRRSKKGKVKLSKTNNLTNRIPGGGIQSTADDLLKFGKAILNYTLINETTTKMMWEKPGLAYDGNPYGMGWFLYGKNPILGEIYGHTGEQTGCSAVLLLAPEKNAVMIVLSNTAHAQSHVFGVAVKQLFPLLMKMSEGM